MAYDLLVTTDHQQETTMPLTRVSLRRGKAAAYRKADKRRKVDLA